eukprot:6158817-Pleurochrysis_carterae.AAC.3
MVSISSTPGVLRRRRETPFLARAGRSQPVADSHRRTDATGKPGCCPQRDNPRAERTPGRRRWRAWCGQDVYTRTAPPTNNRAVAD